ncbi:hypothetical protein AcW1_007278 [Taiwanofungus camphoratus]|nr:hypothetical protein AcV7_004878 [Antrodia cinnamomea]KAI0952927.1 hypothetical protein AcW1_007278 [Antrodia cinnamomea]
MAVWPATAQDADSEDEEVIQAAAAGRLAAVDYNSWCGTGLGPMCQLRVVKRRGLGRRAISCAGPLSHAGSPHKVRGCNPALDRMPEALPGAVIQSFRPELEAMYPRKGSPQD